MLSNKENSYIKKEETFCSNTYHPLPVVLKKGKGVFVWDIHGKILDKPFSEMIGKHQFVNKNISIIGFTT